MPRKASAPKVQEGSAHLDNKKKETKAPGEHAHKGSTLMEGIVVGLTKRISPPIIDGIIRGVPKRLGQGMNGQVSSIKSSATKDNQGAFGSGLFPEGMR